MPKKRTYTLQDLIDKGIVHDATPVKEAQELLDMANDPLNTAFAYTESIDIRKEEAEDFVRFVLRNPKPEHIPDNVFVAMQRIAVQLRLQCNKLFEKWGPW